MTEEEAAENGLTFESLQLLRDNIGVELSFTYPYAGNLNYNVAINELDAPSGVSEDTFIEGLGRFLFEPMEESDYLTSGFYKVNDINYFMIHYQNDTKELNDPPKIVHRSTKYFLKGRYRIFYGYNM